METSETASRTAIHARFSAQLCGQIEEWRRAQPKIPPLATAVRMLVEEGLRAIQAEAAE